MNAKSFIDDTELWHIFNEHQITHRHLAIKALLQYIARILNFSPISWLTGIELIILSKKEKMKYKTLVAYFQRCF